MGGTSPSLENWGDVPPWKHQGRKKRKQEPLSYLIKILRIACTALFSLKMLIFQIKIRNFPKTFSTFHAPAVHGFGIKLSKFSVKNSREKTIWRAQSFNIYEAALHLFKIQVLGHMHKCYLILKGIRCTTLAL